METELDESGSVEASGASSLLQVASRYEAFVDVVCAGARFGATPAVEAKFADSRNWLLPRTRLIAQALADRHESDAEKIALLLDRVLASPTLTQLLGDDDGSLIQRMSWISHALLDAGGEE